jgi:hypothetical protein
VSKLLDATCVGGQVSVGGFPVEADILSQGTAQSSGCVILTGQQIPKYITGYDLDLSETINMICTILDSIITVLSAHDGALGGSQAATIATLTANKVLLLAKKDMLR